MSIPPPFDKFDQSEVESLKRALPAEFSIDRLGELAPYVLMLPPRYINSQKIYQKQLRHHFIQAAATFKEKLSHSNEDITMINENCSSVLFVHPPEIQPHSQYLKESLAKYRALYDRTNELARFLLAAQLQSAEKQKALMDVLYSFAKWLVSHPQPLLFNVARAIPKLNSLTYQLDPHIYKEHRAMKLAFRKITSFLNNQPPQFRVLSENQKFLRFAVDTALDNRKSSTSYFERLSLEGSLFDFFDSASSPLVKAGLVPIAIENEVDSVKKWITDAVAVLYTFDEVGTDERKEALSVFATRYIFDRAFEILRPIYKEDKGISRAMGAISRKTPKEVNIPEKFIPEECSSVPITRYFASSSITAAPVGWMLLSQFQSCPLDLAYCIFKAHESLSIMATLISTQKRKSGTTGDFFSQLPGFDDIIDIWISLLCVSDLASPKDVSDYLTKWSRLPGFPSRFLVCCTYLEASASQISPIN